MMGIPFCPSRHTLHPLYPAFFPSKLTSTDGTTWAPCALASTLVCYWLALVGGGGWEKGEVREFTPLYPSLVMLGCGYVLVPKVATPITWTPSPDCNSPHLFIITTSFCPFRCRCSMLHQRMLHHSSSVPLSLLTPLQIAPLLSCFFTYHFELAIGLLHGL